MTIDALREAFEAFLLEAQDDLLRERAAIRGELTAAHAEIAQLTAQLHESRLMLHELVLELHAVPSPPAVVREIHVEPVTVPALPAPAFTSKDDYVPTSKWGRSRKVIRTKVCEKCHMAFEGTAHRTLCDKCLFETRQASGRASPVAKSSAARWPSISKVSPV